jgi:hypothetical protein
VTEAENRLLEAVLLGESRDLEDLKEKVRRERINPEMRQKLLDAAIEMRQKRIAWHRLAKGYGPDVLRPILDAAEEVPV